MTIDWQTQFLNPQYLVLGKTATLTPVTTDVPIAVTVIPVPVQTEITESGVTVSSVRSAADVRVSELAALNISREDDLDQAEITFNGKTWTILATLPRPTPDGESAGEIRLILSEIE